MNEELFESIAKFTPSRLELARERRGVTQRRLAELVGVSDRMIKAYEAGEKSPSDERLTRIASVLEFPRAFFEAPHVDALDLEAASFRALSKASAAVRHRAVAAGTIGLEFHRFLSERFDLPRPDIPDLRDFDAQRAADTIRHQWGLGKKPIPHVVRLLELHGVRVFSLSEDCDAIDAFSLWRDGTPFVFLNTRKTPERSIFDAAHELGHLLLHRHGSPQGREPEVQADTFASNFLMPEDAVKAAAPKVPTVATVAAMKRDWRASVAALGYRLHTLGRMTEWQYRHFNIELSRRGRSNEMNPLSRETSQVLEKTLRALAEEGTGLREIARELHVPIAELRALSFGLHVVEGGGATGARKASLRLVK
jgi:Zn-dependent peptidase ImmA (M78 family)/DNA-binding XRE family transcriptional regulator